MSESEALVRTLLDAVVAVVGAISAAVISGWVLLRIHHSKVKDELAIRAGGEQLQRKQAAYAEIWAAVNDALDYSQSLLDEINWRKVRAIQTSFLLAGSPRVVQIFNDIMGLIGKEPTSEEDLKRQDLEITKLTKELWNTMRKDLYDAGPLPPEAIRFFGAGKRTLRALEIWGKNRALLERKGIHSLEELSKMDARRVSEDTGIPFEQLVEVKSMADRELLLTRESKAAK